MQRILALDLGGRAVLEDGREVQLVVTDHGLVGATLATPKTEVDRLDQVGDGNTAPTLEGLDQI